MLLAWNQILKQIFMKPDKFPVAKRTERWPYWPLQKGSIIGLSCVSILVCVNQSQRCHNPKFGVSGSIPIPERERERWVGAVDCKCLTNETKACSSSVNIMEESYQWKVCQPTKTQSPHEVFLLHTFQSISKKT